MDRSELHFASNVDKNFSIIGCRNWSNKKKKVSRMTLGFWFESQTRNSKWILKHNMEYPYYGVLLSNNEEETSNIGNNLDVSEF